MLVSIILTTYQRPQLLERSMLSVLKQDLPANFSLELIIADDDPDGTAIATLGALNRTAATNVKLQYLKRTGGDGGVAHSRNRAIKACCGDWIGFLDDDDVMLEDALKSRP